MEPVFIHLVNIYGVSLGRVPPRTRTQAAEMNNREWFHCLAADIDTQTIATEFGTCFDRGICGGVTVM